MSNIRELLNAQSIEIDDLNRLIKNYHKDSPERKTVRYLRDKLKTFDEIFAAITNYNKQIVTEIDVNQPYVREQTYEKIKKYYEDTRKDIIRRLGDEPTIVPNENLPKMNEKNGQSTMDGDSTHEAHNNGVDPSTSALNNGERIEIENDTSNETNFNGSGETTLCDLLQMQYEEFMDIVATARDINESSSVGSVRVHMDMLTSLYGELRKLIFEYKSSGKSISFNYNQLQSKYMSIICKLNDFLQSISSSQSETTDSNPRFSLPKINLPTFNGRPEQWRGFIALFDRMIHTNQKMDQGMKVEYLKGCIKDSAAKLINHLDPTPENYEICYEILRKSYDNKRKLVNTMLDNVLSLQKIKFENAETLKSMYDTVQEAVLGIKTMGVSKEQLLDHLLCHILLQKLDTSTVMHYECQLTNVKELQTLSNFLNYLENRALALQSVNTKHDFHKSKYEKNNSYPSGKKVNCPLCGSNEHALYKCASFSKKSVADRVDWTKSHGICMCCFSTQHRTHDCKSKFTCKTCKQATQHTAPFGIKKIRRKSCKT